MLFACTGALFIVATMCYIIVVDIAPCCAILGMSAEKNESTELELDMERYWVILTYSHGTFGQTITATCLDDCYETVYERFPGARLVGPLAITMIG